MPTSVPKACGVGLKSLSEVPSFLTDAHPEVTDVNEFNRALDGKVLIPQPFAELHSLYGQNLDLLFQIHDPELVVAAVMVLIFTRVAKQLSSGLRRKEGRTLVLSWYLFVITSLAQPLMTHQATAMIMTTQPGTSGDSFVPMLWTLFFLF